MSYKAVDLFGSTRQSQQLLVEIEKMFLFSIVNLSKGYITSRILFLLSIYTCDQCHMLFTFDHAGEAVCES